MAEPSREINIIELLMGIKEDVSSIKTDMANFKETQRAEKEAISRDIADVRSDYRRDLSDLETRFMNKLTGLQSVQNNLVGDVDTLKHAEERKDAKRWKTVMAFVLTSIGSMLLVKLPDFVSFVLKAHNGS
jgi:hypothetical protein